MISTFSDIKALTYSPGAQWSHKLEDYEAWSSQNEQRVPYRYALKMYFRYIFMGIAIYAFPFCCNELETDVSPAPKVHMKTIIKIMLPIGWTSVAHQEGMH